MCCLRWETGLPDEGTRVCPSVADEKSTASRFPAVCHPMQKMSNTGRFRDGSPEDPEAVRIGNQELRPRRPGRVWVGPATGPEDVIGDLEGTSEPRECLPELRICQNPAMPASLRKLEASFNNTGNPEYLDF